MSVVYSQNPVTEWDKDIGKFIVYEEFTCIWRRPEEHTFIITVPKGFKTDFASIPKCAHWIISVVGKHIQAAIVHDYTYERVVRDVAKQEMTKIEADTLFIEGMAELGVGKLRRNVMYRSVRIGGKGRF